VQKEAPNAPWAQTPVVQSLLLAQASPIAPELQRPPELPTRTQGMPSAHCSAAEHVLLALPSVHVPWLALAELFPQNPLRHSLESLQVEPSAPSLHWPSAAESEPDRTQTSLSQSLARRQAEPLLPSLQLPTNDAPGTTQLSPAPH
jgi:hypothetical protein